MSKSEDQTAQDLAAELEALRERQEEQAQTIEQLREEKQELEAEVEAVQNGLSIPKPNRRQLLKAGGTGMAALLFGSAASGNAAAASGTIGSDSQRFDYFADTLDANTVNTDEVSNDDYHESVVTQSGSTGNLDLSAANVFEQTVTGNITFSFNNPSSTPPGNSFLLIVIQDGTGGHSLSWPSSVQWGGGSAPGLSTSANDKHILSFQSPDGGSTWYGFVAAENVA